MTEAEKVAQIRKKMETAVIKWQRANPACKVPYLDICSAVGVRDILSGKEADRGEG